MSPATAQLFIEVNTTWSSFAHSSALETPTLSLVMVKQAILRKSPNDEKNESVSVKC